MFVHYVGNVMVYIRVDQRACIELVRLKYKDMMGITIYMLHIGSGLPVLMS